MQQPSIYRLCFYLLIAALLGGCQSTTAYIPPSEPLLYDQGFSGFAQVNIESEQQVFFLDESAKHFVNETIASSNNKFDQMEALVNAIFDRSELNLLYQGNANTVANQTFHTRAANCLSMSIMTYALANEAGFDVDFQEILIPEYWTRRSGFSLLNGHINIKIRKPKDPTVMLFNTRSYQVDFDPQNSRKTLPKKVVSRQAVLSMFYNNKGADEMLNKNYDAAYAYFREAISIEPSFYSAWINLGILYRLSGHYPQAEKTYQYVLTALPDSLTAWENLAYLYTFTDRQTEAQEILTRVENKRKSNPYYHVNLGEQEIEQKHWDQALSHFRKALALDRSKHEVYFGLARIYYEIGEMHKSERYLKLARNKAQTRQDENRYDNKLAFLNSL